MSRKLANCGQRIELFCAGETNCVAGPTGVSVSTATPSGEWQIVSSTSGPELKCGVGMDPSVCISFSERATSPSGDAGTYEWAQLVTTNTRTLTAGSSTSTCSTGTGLDNQFPYNGDTGLSEADSPGTVLQSASSYSEEKRSFGFTMYFMWDPALTGSIPVPLGSVSWQATGDATSNGSTWSIVQSKSSSSANAFQAGPSFPGWQNVLINLTTTACK